MREIVLDTETTGLDPADGHRIVEIGAVELVNHLPTGATFHYYFNPDRPMPEEAFAVHGLGDEFLRDKPRFPDLAQDFLAFIADAPLIIHNASFDMKFLNAELVRVGHTALPPARAVDTLAIARQRYPGSPASLDALCRRFGVDASARDKHGALLDSWLLAEVYLELIGGRQPGLVLSASTSSGPVRAEAGPAAPKSARPRPTLLPPRLSEEEQAAHAAFIAALGAPSLWHKPG